MDSWEPGFKASRGAGITGTRNWPSQQKIDARRTGRRQRMGRRFGSKRAQWALNVNKGKQVGKTVTAAKAKKILKDGKIRGKKLTVAQKRYFGWIAGGKKPRKRKGR